MFLIEMDDGRGRLPGVVIRVGSFPFRLCLAPVLLPKLLQEGEQFRRGTDFGIPVPGVVVDGARLFGVHVDADLVMSGAHRLPGFQGRHANFFFLG